MSLNDNGKKAQRGNDLGRLLGLGFVRGAGVEEDVAGRESFRADGGHLGAGDEIRARVTKLNRRRNMTSFSAVLVIFYFLGTRLGCFRN